MAKKKKNDKVKAPKNKLNIGFRYLVVAFVVLVCMIMFLPTTFLMTVGLLPSLVAAAVDREPGKNKTFTIAALNLAGCFPYLLGLWTGANNMDMAVSYIADPMTIIVMYSAAGVGYLINMGVTAFVSSILVQRSKKRISRIEEEKQVLENRWGKKVNGQYELDEFGFLKENIPDFSDSDTVKG